MVETQFVFLLFRDPIVGSLSLIVFLNNRAFVALHLLAFDFYFDNFSASTSCFVCENAAEYNCKECRFSFGWERPFVYLCGSCKDLFHQNSTRHSHKVEKLDKRRRTERLQECNEIKELELFAVVCIQTSHYVTFTKCGEVPDDKWVFFDSMADRIGKGFSFTITTTLK